MTRWWDKDCWWALAVVGVLTLPLVAAAALRLTWEDHSQVENAYWVLRQRVPSERDFRLVAELPANTTIWVDTSTRGNQQYCYMVVAVLGQERSYSNVACGSESKDFGAGPGVVRVGWGGRGRQLTINLGQ